MLRARLPASDQAVLCKHQTSSSVTEWGPCVIPLMLHVREQAPLKHEKLNVPCAALSTSTASRRLTQ